MSWSPWQWHTQGKGCVLTAMAVAHTGQRLCLGRHGSENTQGKGSALTVSRLIGGRVKLRPSALAASEGPVIRYEFMAIIERELHVKRM